MFEQKISKHSPARLLNNKHQQMQKATSPTPASILADITKLDAAAYKILFRTFYPFQKPPTKQNLIASFHKNPKTLTNKQIQGRIVSKTAPKREISHFQKA